MRRICLSLVATLLALATASCDRKPSVAPIGSRTTSDTMLAYTYSVSVRLDASLIGARVAALREACAAGKMGSCNLMAVTQKASDANITVRIAPEGVQRMIALAAQDGRLIENQVQAEDISLAVAKTQRDSDELEQYAHRLNELAARKDLPVADLIKLGHEQAEVTVKRQALADTAAGQKRRLDTNMLSIALGDSSRSAHRSDVAGSWDEIMDRSVEGIFDAVGFLGYGLPFLLIAFPMALFWRWGWRKATRRKTSM